MPTIGTMWRPEPVAAKGKSFLHTAAAGHGTAWAFGISVGGHSGLGGSAGFGTLVYRRVDDAWVPVDVPRIGRANRAVVLSPVELWVVGDGTSLHRVGDEWQQVPVARPEGHRAVQLFGLAAFGADVWTTGYAPDSGQSTGRGSVQRWDGERWSERPLPDVSPLWGLSGIGGVAADDLWAVGQDMTGDAAVALHHDGSAWTRVPLPKLRRATLSDVLAVASDDVLAVGYHRPSGSPVREPLALHWDGVEWSVTGLPAAHGQFCQLVRTADAVYGIGYGTGRLDEGPYVVAWDGVEWRAVPGPPTKGFLHGGAALPDGRLLVVGAVHETPYAAVRER